METRDELLIAFEATRRDVLIGHLACALSGALVGFFFGLMTTVFWG